MSLVTNLLRWFRRSLLALVALVVILALVGSAYQIFGNLRDPHCFPQRGRSVQVGKLKLNIDCSGHGGPTVILDSGMGVPGVGWAMVQPEVAKFARVCSYDRAGYGWSEAGPKPRTSLQIAKELRALLDASGEKGPYVMVGHSFGGYNVRVFTGMYPNDVVGVVLVDAEHGDEEKRIDELLSPRVKSQQNQRDQRDAWLDRILSPLRIHLGINRLKTEAGWDGHASLPKELREELLYLDRRSEEAGMAENAADSTSWDQVRLAGDLGDRPLIVLTAGKPYDPDPLLSKEESDEQNDMWINVLQAGEARLSTRGKQVVVPDSGHMIPYERPAAVVSAIREVRAALQQ
ncbi:MAG TPA: alpha/beta hydrolase [Candidatus Acidoferrales bacterium]|jgi:pimeloyl-ACP methyl ester carboxylesterase|nr:alpha/beta hydrolase [Candidatus Acidoferrales bacterium]